MAREMTPSEVMLFIGQCLLMKEIPYVAGEPAIGKSDVFEQVADSMGLKLIDIRLSMRLPEDLTGIPSLDPATGKARYNPFDTFPMEGDEIPKGYHGWMILFDELPSASEEVLAASYSVFLGHKLGDNKIHPRALICAAGNRASDSAIARVLPDTLLTRMLPVEMRATAKDWLKWANALPANKKHDAVIDFIKKYPSQLLSTVPADKRAELETYQSPRGWARVFKIVHLHEKLSQAKMKPAVDNAGVPVPGSSQGGVVLTEDITRLIGAAVGKMGAKAFQEHYDETMQLPYPWEVAQSPSSTRIPSTTIGKAKVSADLAEHFIGTQEQSREALIVYMNRMGGEERALFVQTIVEKLGDTQSDQRLISDIKKRLNVKDIDLGKEVEVKSEDDDSDMFQ
jgi:hypothetical protein